MSNGNAKHAILAALGHEGDFSGLRSLPPLQTGAGAELSRWLDRSGLALSLLLQLQTRAATSQLPVEWEDTLRDRHTRNVTRTLDILTEARRIQAAFQSFGVTFAWLKGFTLSPDFCAHPFYRHQTDFDLLVSPRCVHVAAQALNACGYCTAHVNESSETRFLTPLRHIPSLKDDVYAVQRHRQADLHVSIWEPCRWLPLLEAPKDCLQGARPETTCGTEYPVLPLEDKFLLQVVHAFRHLVRPWIRVAWLLEIGRCVENHRENAVLWTRVIDRAGASRSMKSVFALVLGLVHRLFHSPVPESLGCWGAEAMTPTLRSWLDHFGVDWAIADWPGSLNNAFLIAEFIEDSDSRSRYWRTRLFPRSLHGISGAAAAGASTDIVAGTSLKRFLEWQTARVSYLAHRGTAYLKDLAALPRLQFRWKRVLSTTNREDPEQSAERSVQNGGV